MTRACSTCCMACWADGIWSPKNWLKRVNTTDGVNLLRNLIAAGRILAAVEPDFLYKLSKALDRELQPGGPSAPGAPAPTLLQLFRKVRAEETRRGLGLALGVLSAVGTATQD